MTVDGDATNYGRSVRATFHERTGTVRIEEVGCSVPQAILLSPTQARKLRAWLRAHDFGVAATTIGASRRRGGKAVRP